MNRVSACLVVLSVLATPTLALEIEEIGRIDADFGGEIITQPTVRVTEGDEAESTAFLFDAGGGFSSLSISGYSPDRARIDISAEFYPEMPHADAQPIALEISYAPDGTAKRWVTLDEAADGGKIAFTTLKIEGDQGHVTGTFSGTLCYSEDYAGTPDANNCRPIEGSFDTPFTIEKPAEE